MSLEKGKFFSTQRGKRFIKFAVIGFIGWGLNELLIFLFLLLLDRFFVNDLLLEIWRLDIEKALVASLLSIAIVMVFNFILNKIWTFKEVEKDVQTKALIQFLQFTLIGLTGLAFYTGVMYILFTLLHANEYLASSIAFFVGMINNFIWNDLWTFNPRFKKEKTESSNSEKE
ncbi:MAG: GtrA family protein [Candidatus Heimdallarchaeaceae archaeon]|jgi:putative flippase GtrA